MSRFFNGFNSSNVMDWALPLYTAWGIRVRVHILFVFLAAFEIIRGFTQGYGTWAVFGTVSMFVLVLLHEYGHCISCRMVGGTADDILMWPLGGLASCRPPKRWQPELITVLCGPAVNLVLALLLAPVVLAIGGTMGSLVFNPFRGPSLVGLDAMWKVMVWYLYIANVGLLLFNMLIPMFPMDAGRTLLCLLWSRLPYRRSMWITATVGLIVAVVLGLYSLSGGESRLLTLAFMGGFMCWGERRRIQFLEQTGESDPDEQPYAESLAWREKEDKSYAAAAAKQQRERDATRKLQAEEDRILAKIASQGMQSLTRGERRTLEQATARRRGNS